MSTTASPPPLDPAPANPQWVELFDLPHRAAVEAVATGAPVFVFVNPVEYHGPHLSLHNDRLVSMGVARDLHRALELDGPLLAGADLEVGVDPAPGPGTRIGRAPVVAALVEEACRGLLALGARKVVFMTWHGGAQHGWALLAGMRLLRRHGVQAAAPFHALLHLMVDSNEQEAFDALAELAPDDERQALRASLPTDVHAGYLETSLALRYAPQSVDPCHLRLPDCPAWPEVGWMAGLSKLFGALGAKDTARDMAFAARAMGWGALRPFPGYTGRPRLARAEVGTAFMEHALPLFVDAVRAQWAGDEGRPPLGFVSRLTMGGRLELTPRLGREQVLRAP